MKKPLFVSLPCVAPVGMHTEYVPRCVPTAAVIDFILFKGGLGVRVRG